MHAIRLTLCLDARISILSSQAVLSATQTHKPPTLTKNAAEMKEASFKRYMTGSAAIDHLLDGGLKRGSILEISGPPGVVFDSVVAHITREFVKEGRGVIFAGLSPKSKLTDIILMHASDMHNSMTAAQLLEHIDKDGKRCNTSDRNATDVRTR